MPVATTLRPESYVPKTLKYLLNQQERLSVDDCLRIGLSLATALEHLHRHGLIHRDIKPSNIIFVEGVPKLADIGLISTLDASMSISGTPGYIAPEGSGTPQADIYSLGKVLYEMSMGRDRGEFPNLPNDFASLPDRQLLLELNAVLIKAGHGDPAHRYQTAAELHADLALIRSGKSIKRLRQLERHLGLIKRTAIGVLAASLAISGVWWQTWRAKRVANEHLVRLHVEQGADHIKRGNYLTAMPWLVGALALEARGAEYEKLHRQRIDAVLRQCPRPRVIVSAPGAVLLDADVSADGSRMVTGHYDDKARLWDVSSGKLLSKFAHQAPVHFTRFLREDSHVLTCSFERQAFLWPLSAQDTPALALPHYSKVNIDQPEYAAGINLTERLAYLSMGMYSVMRTNGFFGEITNLTLRLALTSEQENMRLRFQVFDNATEAIMAECKFLDTPEGDKLHRGKEPDPEPLSGSFRIAFYIVSDPLSTNNFAYVDELRVRSYPGTEQGRSAEVLLHDFSDKSAADWITLDRVSPKGTCRVVNGRLEVSQTNRVAGVTGVLFLPALQVQRGHTLEIEANLTSANCRSVELGIGAPKQSRPVTFWSWDPVASPDGEWLALADEQGFVQLWNLVEGRYRTVGAGDTAPQLKLGHGVHLKAVDVDPLARFLATVTKDEGELGIWELKTGRQVPIPPSKVGQTVSVWFSPRGQFLAVKGSTGLALLKVEGWRALDPPLYSGVVGQVAFSPIGHWLAAVCGYRSVHAWDLSDLTESPRSLVHGSTVERLAFSPDGRLLASQARDGLVRIWSVVTGEKVDPPLPGDLVRFGDDGDTLLLTHPDGEAWLWDLTWIRPSDLVVPQVPALESTALSEDQALLARIQHKDVALPAAGWPHQNVSHPRPLRRVWFTQGNRFLVAEDSNLQSWIWDVKTGTLVAPPLVTRYRVGTNAYPKLELPASSLSVKTLTDIAALLSGLRPDGQGGMRSVPPATREALFHKLSSARPQEFQGAAARSQHWHLEQAHASEREGQWTAATFHRKRCLAVEQVTGVAGVRTGTTAQHSRVKDGSSEVALTHARIASERAEAEILEGDSRRSFVPPRPSWAGSDLLDLTSYYTRSLISNVAPAEYDNSYGRLDHGVQILGGVEFDVRGMIEVGSNDVVQIPIQRPARRIHFLHAAKRPYRDGAQPVGYYALQLRSGERLQVQVNCPYHATPYHSERFHIRSPGDAVYRLDNLDSTLAWAGINDHLASRNETLYLSRTTWQVDSHLQEQPISFIEIRGASPERQLLAFAITVE
jgi:WD40 repeat protein